MCVCFFLLPPWKNKALSFPFLFSPGVRVALWLCNVCVCVVPRLCRGGTSRIDLPWVRNEWSRSDGRNGFLFIYFENWGDSFALQGVCVCVCAVEKKGRIEKDKKETGCNTIKFHWNTFVVFGFFFLFYLLLPLNSLLVLVKVFPKQRIHFIESRERSFKDWGMHLSDCHLLNNYTKSA